MNVLALSRSRGIPAVVGLLAGLSVPAVAAQDFTGPRPLLPAEREILLARSAAPPEVSAQATVYVLGADGFTLAVEGTNGVSCLVNRSQLQSLEPHCYDAEASATILPMQLLRGALRQQGMSPDDIDVEIGKRLVSGEFRLPTRPAMTYMMSSEQVLYNPAGERVGNWRPHLMIYYPYLESESLGLYGPPSIRAAVVAGSGTATSSIMVVVEEFVDPAEFTDASGGPGAADEGRL